MKRILGLLALSQLLTLPAQAQDFYRHLMFRETPYAPHVGIHPISAAEARSVAHYRFDYDAEGRVSAITHAIGDKIIGGNGNWDSFTWWGPRLEISYDGDREIHSYYNSEGARATSHGAVHHSVFELNSDGTRRSLRHYGETGEPLDGAWGAHRYEWSRDAEGRIREVRSNVTGNPVTMRPNLEFHEIRLTYGDDGRLIMMQNYGLNGEPSNNSSGAGIDRIYYDLHGNFVRWHVYDKDGRAVRGNAPNVHIGEHLYDHDGNKIGLRGYDTQGRRIDFAAGFNMMRMEYDARGNSAAMMHFRGDGSMIDRTEYEFTPDGRYYSWIKSVTADGMLLASPSLRGAAALHLKRDPANPLAMTRVFYDEDLQEFTPEPMRNGM